MCQKCVALRFGQPVFEVIWRSALYHISSRFELSNLCCTHGPCYNWYCALWKMRNQNSHQPSTYHVIWLTLLKSQAQLAESANCLQMLFASITFLLLFSFRARLWRHEKRISNIFHNRVILIMHNRRWSWLWANVSWVWRRYQIQPSTRNTEVDTLLFLKLPALWILSYL